MKLELKDDNGKFVKELTDDSKTLDELGVVNGYHVHVSDPTIEAGLYDNILRQDAEEGFKLSDEQYAERRGKKLILIDYLGYRYSFGLEETAQIRPI